MSILHLGDRTHSNVINMPDLAIVHPKFCAHESNHEHNRRESHLRSVAWRRRACHPPAIAAPPRACAEPPEHSGHVCHHQRRQQQQQRQHDHHMKSSLWCILKAVQRSPALRLLMNSRCQQEKFLTLHSFTSRKQRLSIIGIECSFWKTVPHASNENSACDSLQLQVVKTQIEGCRLDANCVPALALPLHLLRILVLAPWLRQSRNQLQSAGGRNRCMQQHSN